MSLAYIAKYHPCYVNVEFSSGFAQFDFTFCALATWLLNVRTAGANKILNQNYRANNQIGTSRETATLMLAVAVMSWIKHTNRYYYKHVAIAYTVQCHAIRTLSRATCIKIWKNTLQQFVCLVVLPNRQPPPQLTNVAIILMRIKRPLCIWTSIQLTARRVSMMKLSLLVLAAVITVAVGVIPTEFEVPGDNFSCRAKTCADIGTEESNLLCLVVSNFFWEFFRNFSRTFSKLGVNFPVLHHFRPFLIIFDRFWPFFDQILFFFWHFSIFSRNRWQTFITRVAANMIKNGSPPI